MPRSIPTRISKSNATKSRIWRMRGRRKRKSDSSQLHPLLQLQQTIGNQAVGRMIQAKLEVGQPGDKFEQEADRVAEQVVNTLESVESQSTPTASSSQGTSLQRVPETEEDKRVLQGPHEAFEGPLEEEGPVIRRMAQVEEDEEQTMRQMPMAEEDEEENIVSTKPLIQRMPETESEEDQGEVVAAKLDSGAALQRRVENEEEQGLQAKHLPDRATQLMPKPVRLPTHSASPQIQPQGARGQASQVSSATAANIHSLKGGGSPLPRSARSFFESRIGEDFSQVRVHTDSKAVQLNQELKAQAFTHGQDVYFGAGKYSTKSNEGKRLLAHELTHVLQQTGISEVRRQSQDAGVPLPAGVPQTSAISQELESIWLNQGKGALFQRLRNLNPDQRTDSDSYAFLSNNLSGDDYWLAENLLSFGPESQWPIVYRVERELKGWPNSRGFAGVLSLVNGASNDDKRSILTTAHLMNLLKNTFSASQFSSIFMALGVSTLISGAPDWQKRWILTDTTLMNIIKSQLSPPQFTSLVAAMVNLSYIPAGKIQDAVAQLIVSPELVDRNTATHLINGHIKAYYIEELQQPADRVAVLNDAGLDPNIYTVYLEPPENVNQFFVTLNGVGFTAGNSSKIAGSRALSLDRWKELLVHETSHSRNLDREHPDDSFERYKGEFRAYWVAEYRNVANLNNRASQIKAHILRNYPAIKAAYDSDADFKRQIDAHTRPDSNLTNE